MLPTLVYIMLWKPRFSDVSGDISLTYQYEYVSWTLAVIGHVLTNELPHNSYKQREPWQLARKLGKKNPAIQIKKWGVVSWI